jgi:hypothetical protein
MNRSLAELIKDYEADPSSWQIVRIDVVPSTNIRNKGGSSVQELLRHQGTGEEMVRHTVRKADGTVFAAPHFRPHWK